MLEERLSNTYSQHNLGNYGSHAPRPSSNIYPSIPPNIASGHGPAESFYTGNSIASADGYVYSGPKQDSYAATHAAYAPYDRNIPLNAPTTGPGPSSYYSNPQQGNYDQQRAPEYQAYPQSPVQRRDSQYLPESKGQAYNQNAPLPSPMPTSSAHPSNQMPMSPVQSVASYYEEPQSTVSSYQQQSQQSTNATYTRSQSSPEQYHQNLPQHQPIPQQPSYQLPLTQHSGPPPSQQQQQIPPPMQPYWQQPQFSQQPQSQPPPQSNVPYPTMNNYTQESFPPAPNHQPQPMPVEEALIEL